MRTMSTMAPIMPATQESNRLATKRLQRVAYLKSAGFGVALACLFAALSMLRKRGDGRERGLMSRSAGGAVMRDGSRGWAGSASWVESAEWGGSECSDGSADLDGSADSGNAEMSFAADGSAGGVSGDGIEVSA